MQVCATPSAHIRKNARDSTLQRSASDFRLQTSDWESGIKSRKAAVAGRWPCHSLALSTAPTALLTLYKLGDFYLMPYSEYTSYVDTLALFLCRTSKAKSEEVKCSWYVDYVHEYEQAWSLLLQFLGQFWHRFEEICQEPLNQRRSLKVEKSFPGEHILNACCSWDRTRYGLPATSPTSAT